MIMSRRRARAYLHVRIHVSVHTNDDAERYIIRVFVPERTCTYTCTHDVCSTHKDADGTPPARTLIAKTQATATTAAQ